MLAAISAWGLEQAVKKFIGMFAFALWDNESKVLRLIRDRLGVKPLYYGWAGNTFVFGSELKALRVHPNFSGDIDRNVLALYLRYNYVPAPYSIYHRIFKLEPGHILTITRNTRDCDKTHPLPSDPYWSAREVFMGGAHDPVACSEKEAVDALHELLTDSVRLRLVSDVPVGAFLSGGIDSSTVVALMQSLNPRPVKTFSIGFQEADYNEAHHAKNVARHLGTDHSELYVTDSSARQLIPDIPTMYDEPFADPSQIPTILVSRLARQSVTVSLSGDGGDEVFLGYGRYFATEMIRKNLSRFPRGARRGLAYLMKKTPIQVLNILAWPLRKVLYSRGYQPSNMGHRLRVLGGYIEEQSITELYRNMVSSVLSVAEIVPGSREPETVFDKVEELARTLDTIKLVSYLDLVSMLPDDMLVKVDRASMSVGLEARVPLLDHRVIEFVASLPSSIMIKKSRSKHLLRLVLSRYVPERLTNRPKMGFSMPVDQWMRGPLRSWAEDLLEPGRLRCQGYLDPDPIGIMWKEHLSGARNWSFFLWAVLMFQAWLDSQCSIQRQHP
jgi:asparagine synthase (glutamine-hydrolysing)